MTLDHAIEILEAHNAWRRDRSEVNPYPMQNPTDIGNAIDVVTKAAKDHSALLLAIKKWVKEKMQ